MDLQVVLCAHHCDLEQVSTRARIGEGLQLLVPLHILDLNFVVETHAVVIVTLFAKGVLSMFPRCPDLHRPLLAKLPASEKPCGELALHSYPLLSKTLDP